MTQVTMLIVFVIGTLALLIFLAWATFRSARLIREIPADVNLLLLPAENILRALLILACIGLGYISGLSFSQLGWSGVDLARDIVTGFLAGIMLAVLLPPLTHFAIRHFGPQIYSPLVILRVLPRMPHEWIFVPLALGSSVLLEELLFRSLLLGGFGFFLPPIFLAVAWSILFGVMHLPQGTLGIIAAGALGLILSALFLATQSLIAPFIAHYAINLLQIVWASLDRNWLEDLVGDTRGNI